MTRTEARRLRPGDRIAIHGRTLTIRTVTRRWPWSRDIILRGRLDTGSRTLYRVNARKELQMGDPGNPYDPDHWVRHEDA